MKKSQLINLFLVLSVIVGTFVILEFFVENYLITQTPIKFQFALPRGLAVLAQSSKSKRIPDNYIAIVGDSYAQGKGDWLLSIDTNSNDAFNSAHALQNLTKHDVINYGKSGASNIRGWVREPIARSQFIHKHIDKSLKHPKIILAYFYAGNDLQENILDVRESFIPQYGQKSLNDNDVWNDFFQKSIENYKVSPFSDNNSNLGWFARASFKILKNEFKTKKTGDELGDIRRQKTGVINTILLKGNSVNVPDNLQSPALELSDDETELGFLAFTKSLRYLKTYFNNSSIIVVYIPSVIESYTIASQKISISHVLKNATKPLKKSYTSAELKQRSDKIATRVKIITENFGLKFIDTRTEIRAAASEEIIHGPIDWLHFNRRGYEVLAKTINNSLTEY